MNEEAVESFLERNGVAQKKGSKDSSITLDKFESLYAENENSPFFKWWHAIERDYKGN